MNPEELAYMYCDQHVIKILLEICQMMYTAWFYSDQTEYVESNAPYTVNGARRGYKAAHKKHPTTLWISSSIDNYNFAGEIGMSLALEYNKRTLKGRGKPVGIFSKCSWEVQEIELPDKFLLALVSDGVLELLPGKSLKEKEKFISDSVSQSDESIEDICERLGVSKTKKDAPDDVTVLTLRKGE